MLIQHLYGWLFAGFVVLCVGSIYSGLCSSLLVTKNVRVMGPHDACTLFLSPLGAGISLVNYMIMKLVCD